MNAAKHWALWEAQCATLRPNPNVVDYFSDSRVAIALARIEAHYFVHNAFVAANQIIDNMDILKDIPATIIHGRYDMVCPLNNAYELCKHWPSAEFHIIRDAGHSSREPSVMDALIKATENFAKKRPIA